MKTMLYIAPKGDSGFVTELDEAHSTNKGGVGAPDVFRHLSMTWFKTLHGYETEFRYLLRMVPASLRDVPLTKVIIEDHVDFDPLMEDGLYEPSDVGIFAQVETYTNANGTFHTLRIETNVSVEGTDLIALANEYYGKIRRHEIRPTTLWVPTPPAS